MISRNLYIQRRQQVKKALDSGIVVMLGNNEVPFNYPANPYDFRQDSNFLYLFGINQPGFAAVIDIDSGQELLFGDDIDIESVVWTGEQKTVQATANECGVERTALYRELKNTVEAAIKADRAIHFLPFYRNHSKIEMGEMLGLIPTRVNEQSSMPLVQTLIRLRSIKDQAEIAELTDAVNIACEMHLAVMNLAMPGNTEQEIAGRIRGIAFSRGSALSFPPILTVDGEILHNLKYINTLSTGRLLLADAGAENNAHYTSDISRTVPVGGIFSSRQRDIYEIVLKANSESISRIQPGRFYRDIHLASAEIIVDGLKDLGLMKGNTADAVADGAHALFFPHGLGHMLGLDAHDMEGLGEDHVGYDETVQRSSQFGLAYLRLAKRLEAGFVVTIEPGIYFIPALIERWKAEAKWSEFIDFEKVEAYRDFGGVRIEDNIVVTTTGQLNLSCNIPKTVEEIEAVMARE